MLIVAHHVALSNTTIVFNVKFDSAKVEINEPFDGFANVAIKSSTNYWPPGYHYVSYKISQPTFIRININNRRIDLFCEEGDSIFVDIGGKKLQSTNNISISGDNYVGNSFYNFSYNQNPILKFNHLRETFESNFEQVTDVLLDSIKNVIDNETKWVREFYWEGKVSEAYKDYVTMEIASILGWEVGNLCEYYKRKFKDEFLAVKSTKVKQKLFALVDPLDGKLKTCLSGVSYYHTYLEETYGSDSVDIDDIIVSDTPYYSFAPVDVRGYLWGYSLYSSIMYNPRNYCTEFEAYKKKYPDNEYVKVFEKLDLCKKGVEDKKYTIVTGIKSDIFNTVSFYFYKKRVLIDLWATWCAPCKTEFSKLDQSFYSLLDSYKVGLFYISIDKNDREKLWQREVASLNLKGTHLLADTTLQNSIKEVVYSDGPMIIPRYILVDENGLFLTVDMPRPSHSEFEDTLKSFFSK